MAADVFISHSSEDHSIAIKICELLEKRGLVCWIAPRDVRPGRHFAEEILDAIEGTSATIIILSENANKSTHVRNEIERAVSKGKPVLPIRIRNINPARSLELYISSSHWIDAWSPPIEQKADEIVASLNSLFEQATMNFELPLKSNSSIGALAIGGGAIRALEPLTSTQKGAIRLIASHTYGPTLDKCSFPNKIQFGRKLLNGNNTGGNVRFGLEAAHEAEAEILDMLTHMKLLFVVTCLGGGTGSGAAPFICKISKKMGILTLAVVSTPFKFEGNRRIHLAHEGITELSKYADTVISVSNQQLKRSDGSKSNSFSITDSIMSGIVQDITDIVVKHGYINYDFADLENVFRSAGLVHIGIGYGKGSDAVKQAAKAALSSPLLNGININSLNKVVIIHKTGPNASLESMSEAQTIFEDDIPNDSDMVYCYIEDETFIDESQKITLILI